MDYSARGWTRRSVYAKGRSSLAELKLDAGEAGDGLTRDAAYGRRKRVSSRIGANGMQSGHQQGPYGVRGRRWPSKRGGRRGRVTHRPPFLAIYPSRLLFISAFPM